LEIVKILFLKGMKACCKWIRRAWSSKFYFERSDVIGTMWHDDTVMEQWFVSKTFTASGVRRQFAEPEKRSLCNICSSNKVHFE